MRWRPDWDLGSIPEAEFSSEIGRRRAAKRTHYGHAPTIYLECPFCKEMMGTKALRLHKGKCPSNPRNRS